jgi:ubiquinone/menaquinone biosynthesis C-methylase UbiE
MFLSSAALTILMATYYDRIAPGYSELHGDEQRRKIELVKRHLVVKPDDLMLDIGCGPYFGDFACKVIGIDTSLELLKQANIPVALAEAESLPFADSSFDIVISLTALQNFDDPAAALDEALRVGKHRFCFTFLKASAKAKDLEKEIRKRFKVTRKILERTDMILFAERY